VAGATGLRAGVAQIDGKAVLVQAADPASMADTIKLDVVRGELAELDASGIAVWKSVADDNGWKIGQAIPAVFAQTGHRTLHLAAVYRENTVGNYFLGTAAYDANFAARLDMKVFVKAAAGVSTAEVRRAVETVTNDYPGVDILDRAEYKTSQAAPFNQLLSMVYVLLALAVVIALLGIANTLALSISERTREVGLLRAVGMTRSQLRSTIRWEAVIIALQGTVLGLLIGTFFGWALTRAMRDQGITTFAYPWASLAVVVVIAAAAGALAAVQPSRRAAKLDVLRAVVTE
jgi:putative ABC transport system permease protein